MLRPLGLAFAFVSLAGCATAFHGTTHYIVVKPQGQDLTGASVWVNGKPTMVESLRIEHKADQAFGSFRVSRNTDPFAMGPGLSLIPLERCGFCPEPRVIIKKVGYKDHTLPVERHISPIFWANFLNVFGFVVDLYSGFMWSYEPQSVQVQLEKEGK